MPKLPIFSKKLVELGITFLEVFGHLNGASDECHGQGMKMRLKKIPFPRCHRPLCGVLPLVCRCRAVRCPFVRILVEVARWSVGLRDASLLHVSEPVRAFLGHLRVAYVLAKMLCERGKPRMGSRDDVPPFSFGVRSVRSFYSLDYP